MIPEVGKKFLFFKTSFWLYCAIAMVFCMLIDFKTLSWQYCRYLGWNYAAENYQNLNDGVLYYENFTKLFPKDADAYASLGILYYRLNDYPNAIAAYQIASKLNPSKYLVKK